MQAKILTPRQSLNKAYLKEKILRSEIELLKNNLNTLFVNIDHEEREENAKTILRDFLNDTYYKEKHFINTLRNIDLVIYLENNQNKAAVLAEVKRPKNKLEMITKDNLNATAMHELILYYLEERIDYKNNDIKFLIATNIYEWFIFDATVFEHLFFKNKSLVKNYERWRDKQKTSGNTDLFYKEIAKPFLDEMKSEIPFTYFNLAEYLPDRKAGKKTINKTDPENEKKLIALYKILSPVHFLKQPFTNDSNSLDRNFYNELLHIIGLVELKDKNKKIIGRKPEADRDPGSIIENVIVILQTENILSGINNVEKYGSQRDERHFNLALELTITWINRILFLKLLESQLFKYHNDDKYKFLNSTIVKDFDELYKLFHQVLAVPTADRSKHITAKFSFVPYLNSSLFEISDLERDTIKINSLDDNTPLDLYKVTILKDKSGKKKSDKLPVLHYLFEFLDAYDFTSEGKEEIQDDKKTLINASVLGLIFEKINGYKDGSFFTPGFITMYMCRETLTRSVVQKFNDKYKWQCESLPDVKNHLSARRKTSDILEFNSVINSIKICDPAVGSGHFLVSALNELIAIKSELGLLADDKGELLSDYDAHVENDELIITYNNGEDIFEYHPPKDKKNSATNKLQRVQESFFNEKQTIIENCLFGVDINPNSVKIARLRLWIELLKNAFYTKESSYSELETLPNIDINIKEGNSLISRFSLDANLKSALKTIRYTIDDYKNFVRDYKNTNNKEEKANFRKFIDDIKSNFRTEISKNDPRQKKLSNFSYDLHNKFRTEKLFGDEGIAEKDKEKLKLEEAKLEKEINKLSRELEEEKNNAIYVNSFEWRFEFPEVLDNEGKFVGFDVVIGNPPYLQMQNDHGKIADTLKDRGYSTFERTGDIYSLFYEQGFNLLIENGVLTFITSSQWMKANYGRSLRNLFLLKNPLKIILLGPGIFENATVDTNILIAKNCENKKQLFGSSIDNLTQIETSVSQPMPYVSIENWSILDPTRYTLSRKISEKGKALRLWNLKINFGIKTGYNQAFIIDETKRNELVKNDSRSKEIVRPVLKGREIEKYYTKWDGDYIISTFPAMYIDISKYKSVKKYLECFLPKLEQVGETFINATGEKENTRKKTSNKWFETQDQIGFHEEFSKEKIIWKRIGSLLRFSYSDDEIYCLDSTCIATGEKIKYLTALLNSKLCRYQLFENSPRTGMGDLIISVQALEPLLIYYPNEKEQKSIETIVNKILSAKKKNPNVDTTELEAEIDKLVYQLYGLTEEEIKIVEGI